MHLTPESAFYVFLAVAGTLIWLLGVCSRHVKSRVAPPLVVTLAGIALGLGMPQPRPLLLGFLEPLSWISVGFGVTSFALGFSPRELRELWKPATLITLAAMLGMWGVAAAIVWALFDLSVERAFLIGAILTPTDPVVASSIITGALARRCVPERVRNLLAFESSINDGIAFPFVYLPILLIEPAHGATRWAVYVVLWQVIAGALIGAVAGWVAGLAYRAALHRGMVKPQQAVLASLTLTVAVLAGMRAISVDSVFAVLTASLAFARHLPREPRTEIDLYQESGVYLSMVPTLLLFGMAIPWSDWGALGGALPAAAAALILARRIPAVALIYSALRRSAAREITLKRVPDMLFYGWFGPMGLSSIFYAMAALDRLQDERVWAISSFVVLASLLVHGLTAAPFTRWYGACARGT